jgi:hypothetical protein
MQERVRKCVAQSLLIVPNIDVGFNLWLYISEKGLGGTQYNYQLSPSKVIATF